MLKYKTWKEWSAEMKVAIANFETLDISLRVALFDRETSLVVSVYEGARRDAMDRDAKILYDHWRGKAERLQWENEILMEKIGFKRAKDIIFTASFGMGHEKKA